MGNYLRQHVLLSSVAVKRPKYWLLAASCLVPLSLGVSEPALAQTFPAGNYPSGISVSSNKTPIIVTLDPGVQVVSPAGSDVERAVALDSTNGSPGTGGPATLIAPAVTINTTNTLPPNSFTTGLYILAAGSAFVGTPMSPVSGMITVTGGEKTKGIWAQVSTDVNLPTTPVASVTYNGPGITVTGGGNSSDIEACTNVGCGNPGNANGNAIINATGNFTMVGGGSSFGLKANGSGNGTATVNFNGGTIDLTGGSFSNGIFATAGGSATVTTLAGTTIIVSSTGAAPTGVEAFSDSGAATASVASTITINGNPAVPTTNYKSNPTGIRVQSDTFGDASVTYTGPGITVHGGGGLGIVALAGSPDTATQSGRVTVDASMATGPIVADGSNAVGILADSGFIRNVFSSGGRSPTTMTGLVDVTTSNNVSTPGEFGTAISATGGSGGVMVNILSGAIMGGWQPDTTSTGSVYGLRATGVVLGSVGGGNATLNNFGSIGALSDRAIASPLPSFFPNSTSSFPTSNNTTINNNGTITGFVELVGDKNSFINNGLFNLRHFADTTGAVDANGNGVRDTVRVAKADLGPGIFINNGTLALPAVGATTLDSTGQYLPLGNPNNAMTLGGPLQGQLLGVTTFTNSGTIDLQANPAAGDVLLITGGHTPGVNGGGTYISNGGTLKLDTVLNQGDVATRSDTLVIDGTSVGGLGPTNMIIRNAVVGVEALTIKDGILVVQVIDPTRSDPRAFSLSGGKITAGAFDYFLFHGGVTQGSQGNWYLRNELVAPPVTPPGPGEPAIPVPTPAPGTPPLPTIIPGEAPIPLYDPEVPLKSVVPSLARTLGLVTLGTFNERQGDQLLVRGDPNTRVGVWGRVFGQGTREH